MKINDLPLPQDDDIIMMPMDIPEWYNSPNPCPLCTSHKVRFREWGDGDQYECLSCTHTWWSEHP